MKRREIVAFQTSSKATDPDCAGWHEVDHGESMGLTNPYITYDMDFGLRFHVYRSMRSPFTFFHKAHNKNSTVVAVLRIKSFKQK